MNKLEEGFNGLGVGVMPQTSPGDGDWYGFVAGMELSDGQKTGKPGVIPKYTDSTLNFISDAVSERDIPEGASPALGQVVQSHLRSDLKLLDRIMQISLPTFTEQELTAVDFFLDSFRVGQCTRKMDHEKLKLLMAASIQDAPDFDPQNWAECGADAGELAARLKAMTPLQTCAVVYYLQASRLAEMSADDGEQHGENSPENSPELSAIGVDA